MTAEVRAVAKTHPAFGARMYLPPSVNPLMKNQHGVGGETFSAFGTNDRRRFFLDGVVPLEINVVGVIILKLGWAVYSVRCLVSRGIVGLLGVNVSIGDVFFLTRGRFLLNMGRRIKLNSVCVKICRVSVVP